MRRKGKQKLRSPKLNRESPILETEKGTKRIGKRKPDPNTQEDETSEREAEMVFQAVDVHEESDPEESRKAADRREEEAENNSQRRSRDSDKEEDHESLPLEEQREVAAENEKTNNDLKDTGENGEVSESPKSSISEEDPQQSRSNVNRDCPKRKQPIDKSARKNVFHTRAGADEMERQRV